MSEIGELFIQLNTVYTYIEKWRHLLVRTQENSYGKLTVGVKMTGKISSSLDIPVLSRLKFICSVTGILILNKHSINPLAPEHPVFKM
jgi:hypothetical protein